MIDFMNTPIFFVSKGHSGAGQPGGGGGSERAAEPSGALVEVRCCPGMVPGFLVELTDNLVTLW